MFEFPVPGTPRDAAADLANRPRYSVTADGRLYRPQLQVLVTALTPTRRGRPTWANAQIDTGADCTFLKESFAYKLGLSPPASSSMKPFQTAAGLAAAWFAAVRLHLGYPGNINQFDWVAHIGFMPDAALPRDYHGLFGVGGGLEAFAHIELVLSPTGRGMPVTRVWTHDGPAAPSA